MNNKPKANKLLWELWPGKNRFLCKGKLMLGPKCDLIYYLPCTIGIITIPIFFFLFVVPYIWTNVTQSLPIISAFLYLSTLLFYFMTTFTEPGIIPRKKIMEIINSSSDLNINEIVSMDLNKFCTTCQIYKPPRSHHCKNCDNCVEIFDHHCPFINNCIGGRNYAYFFLFTMSLTFLTFTDVTGCFLFIFNNYSIEACKKHL